MGRFFLTIILFLTNISYAQEILKGFVVSNNNPVSFATIKNIDSNKIFQTNEKGEFVIEFLSMNDSLNIFCLGYESSKIKISDIIRSKMISVIPKEELLDEIIITIDKKKEDKKWKVFGKKIRKNIALYEPIIEGCGLISSFVMGVDVKISAIKFIVYTNPLPKDYVEKHPITKTYKKKVRAIFMINSENLNDNILCNHFAEIEYKEEGQYLEIDFGKSIDLKEGEIISFGLELIPEDLQNTIKDNLIGIATVSNENQNKQKTILKTFKPEEIAEQVCNAVLLDDIYFELKVEK